MSMIAVLQVVAFMAAVWIGGQVLQALRGSPLLGEIVAGILLGPKLLNIVPHTEALELSGKVGVLLLVLESGMAVDTKTLIGGGILWRSVAIAVTGTVVPVVLGWVVLGGFGFPSWPNALVAAASLCPTSLGVAAKMLQEMQATQTPMGQLICAAAVLDDVLSLILLGALTASLDGNLSVWTVLLPTLGATLYLLLGFVLASRVPKPMKIMLALAAGREIPPEPTINPTSLKIFNGKIRKRREDMSLILLLFLCLGLAWVADLFTSFLLGAFVAGMAFSRVEECPSGWKRQVQRLCEWLSRMFFACAIGFVVPMQAMMSMRAILPGLILALVAVVGKLICGVFAFDRPNWKGCSAKVGWAMVPRGEFAFIILGMAQERGVIEDTEFSAAVWAILLATFFAPFAFRMLMMKDRLERLRIMHLEAMGTGHGLAPKGVRAELMGGVIPSEGFGKRRSRKKKKYKVLEEVVQEEDDEELLEEESSSGVVIVE